MSKQRYLLNLNDAVTNLLYGYDLPAEMFKTQIEDFVKSIEAEINRDRHITEEK